LTNIRDTKCNLVLFCNAGKTLVTKKGKLKGYDTIWFYPIGEQFAGETQGDI